MSARTMVMGACVGALAAVAGCAKPGVASAGPQPIERAGAVAAAGRFVPAGTTFTVRLDDALGTASSYKGQPFTATVESALRGTAGGVIVPAGAKVHGVVAQVETGRVPSLKLDFQTIDTRGGPQPIEARIARAARVNLPGPNEVGRLVYFDPWVIGYDPYLGYDAIFYPYPPLTAYGYGRGEYAPAGTPREILIPSHAALLMTLTRPLVAAGAPIPR